MRSKSTVRALIRGGVPVLKRRRGSPIAARQSASSLEGCRPSGPEDSTHSPTMVRPRRYVPEHRITALTPYTAPVRSTTCRTEPSSVRRATTSPCRRVRCSCRSSVCFITCWYFRRSAWARREWTAGPFPRLSIRYWMQAASAPRAISPPRASSSRTRCPFPVPPMAGLQGILPTASRFMVRHTVSSPIRAAASAASMPACPAPMTAISNCPAKNSFIPAPHSQCKVSTATCGWLKSRGIPPSPRVTKTCAS